jgi:hypothetical protein
MAIAGSCQCKEESDLMIRHLRFAELTQLSDPGAENLDQWKK